MLTESVVVAYLIKLFLQLNKYRAWHHDTVVIEEIRTGHHRQVDQSGPFFEKLRLCLRVTS